MVVQLTPVGSEPMCVVCAHLGTTVDDGRLPVRPPLPVYRARASVYQRDVPDLPRAGHQRPRHLRRVIQQARAVTVMNAQVIYI